MQVSKARSVCQVLKVPRAQSARLEDPALPEIPAGLVAPDSLDCPDLPAVPEKPE